MSNIKVAVIGGGVAGLVTARELVKAQILNQQITVFEKSDRVGGTWVYDPHTSSPSSVIHSSMYLSLRTNLPRQLMGFSDYPFAGVDFGGDPRTFPGHREVLAFLEAFAAEFGILELIRFGCEVVRVRGGGPWIVKWKKKKMTKRMDGGEVLVEEEEEELFDAVVVCNGHCTVPRLAADIPGWYLHSQPAYHQAELLIEINIFLLITCVSINPNLLRLLRLCSALRLCYAGIDKWTGDQIHSHSYRTPEPFKDKVVVIIGNGPSALDISRDISTVAKQVHLSSRSPQHAIAPLSSSSSPYHHRNIRLHSQIDHVDEDGNVAFQDGTSVTAHVIFHCTGYKYEFPFLKTDEINLTVRDNRVGPLYKHVFPPHLAPSLSFVGLPHKVIVFAMIELQSKWVASVLSGKAKLPSKDEMMADVHQYYHNMSQLNIPDRHTHYLYAPIEFEYLDWIADQAGEVPVENWKKDLYRAVLRRISGHSDDDYRDSWDIDTWIPSPSTILQPNS